MRDALPRPHGETPLTPLAPGVVVIGVGNELRGDDAAGPLVMAQLRETGLEVSTCHDGTELLDLWQGVHLAIVVDAVVTGAPAGTIHRFTERLRMGAKPSSTHTLGVDHAVELARALGRLPPKLIVYGIEGTAFGVGEPLSAAVSAAIPRVARHVRDEVASPA